MSTNDKRNLDRRDFNRLSAAALGGMIGGVSLGCGESGKPDVADTGSGGAAAAEFHLCRGLNECKGKGKGGDNDCAGAGACSSLAAHACGGHNECKGQGGCGKEVGLNECKGKGGCAIPLMEGAWDEAREKFEAKMKEAGKEAKPAPAPML
ncbi:hypothetical protein LOC68_15705 [Blastopirellula sp. JC732]|uniref:Uncharacterized protein n=1 Tax=Blastopirellula sediminis TaxID=2894196 RepID=A0A9X1MP80_9BACT|nr:hypothetical protein [Blastopirellula sediminis]MCC9606869.1 hypothetical protein [Blastopirellula sediminis]MCC9629835.1 hypothetical protein [Blastopirellula sediminis]